MTVDAVPYDRSVRISACGVKRRLELDIDLPKRQRMMTGRTLPCKSLSRSRHAECGVDRAQCPRK